MISIKQAREIMEKEGEKYSDEEMQQFIDGANALAEIFIEDYLIKHEEKKKKLTNKGAQNKLEI